MEEEKRRFVADVHLGGLARLLRLLGLDTAYRNELTFADLLRLAAEEGRTLLSRNGAFDRQAGLSFFQVRSENTDEQLREVLVAFSGLALAPFTRCLRCNGRLQPVAKESVRARLEENTARFFEEFWQCDACGKLYWKGSHYDRMLVRLEEIRRGLFWG